MQWRKATLATAVSAGAGAALWLLHVPLAWMLGPLAAVLAMNIGGKDVQVDRKVRDAGLVMLGYGVGIAFTHETGLMMLHQLPSMLLLTVLMLLYGFATAALLNRWTDIGLSTAVIGLVPGGLSQMVVLGEEMKRADVTTVAFLQTARLLTILFTVPFLAAHGMAGTETSGSGAASMPAQEGGALLLIACAAACAVGGWVAGKLRFPTPFFLGPVLVAASGMAAGMELPAMPDWVVQGAQWMLGMYLGASMKAEVLRQWRKLLPAALASSAGIVVFAVALGALLDRLYPIGPLTAFLSSAPGGMAEMAVTAHNLHADQAMVGAYQLFRVLFILIFVPPALRWWLKRRETENVFS